jgi:hypothetical protein
MIRIEILCAAQILLVWNALACGEEHVIPGVLRLPQQLSILQTLETRPLHSVNFVAGQMVPEIDREAFRRAEASCHPGKQRFFRLLKSLDSHLARHAWELMQEFTKRMPALQVVHQVFERHAGALEAGSSVHDFRVGHYGGIAHNTFILLCSQADEPSGNGVVAIWPV